MFLRTSALFLLRAVKSGSPALERSTAAAMPKRSEDGRATTRANPTRRDDSSDQEGAGKANDRRTRILDRTPCHHSGWAEISDYLLLAGERGSGSRRSNGHLPRGVLRRAVDVDRTHVAA